MPIPQEAILARHKVPSYRGITLKEYFGICDKTEWNGPIKQMEHESRSSSQNSFVQTPCFAVDRPLKTKRPNLKTEVTEEDAQNHYKVKLDELRPKIVSDWRESSKNARQNAFHKKQGRRVAKFRPQARGDLEGNNRSTLASFYQCEENKKKMLRKMDADRKRIGNWELSEAFCITKYGSKFHIDTNILIQ